jgi:CheY-like chemotaxis protein
MEEKTLARLFEPFFTTKPVGEGSGLGLSVVHGIVESHHGAILVHSERGRGTTFELYFPAAAASRPSAAPLTAAARPTPGFGRGRALLYVDDEPALVRTMVRFLGRLDYRVTTSGDPGEALAGFLAQPAAIDVVVTDLSMPGLSGLELIRQMRKQRPDLPAVLISGNGRPEDGASALGRTELVTKPAIEELRGALERLQVAGPWDEPPALR